MTFRYSGHIIGIVALDDGHATHLLPTLSVGIHALSVEYSGERDARFSASSRLAQVVPRPTRLRRLTGRRSIFDLRRATLPSSRR